MLGLKHATGPSFVQRFEANIEEMLLDHAHCEKKAAATALALISKYPDFRELTETMADIVEEEMQHFRQVVSLLNARGWAYRGARASGYAGQLHRSIRSGFSEGLVDRLIIAALIEARSCERFALLGEHLSDPELAAFYRSLYASEARHYTTYVGLARCRVSEAAFRARLGELLDLEASIIARGEDAPRLHA